MKSIKLTTGKGIALYPWLFTPDTKFSTEGTYSLTLQTSVEDGAALRDQLQNMLDENIKDITKTTGKKPSKVFNLPVKEAEDKEGNPCLQFKFKMKPSFTGRDGQPVSQRPFVIDAKKNVLTAEHKVGHGSEVKVNFTASPYSVAAGSGVACRLVGVQVLNLVAWGGEDSSFTIEEGFAAPELPKQAPVSQDSPETVADAANF